MNIVIYWIYILPLFLLLVQNLLNFNNGIPPKKGLISFFCAIFAVNFFKTIIKII